jgi:hypothetical protein
MRSPTKTSTIPQNIVRPFLGRSDLGTQTSFRSFYFQTKILGINLLVKQKRETGRQFLRRQKSQFLQKTFRNLKRKVNAKQM